MNALPTIAIVGRPNVGKSTLFNRITGRRRAIVHAIPGVTRDVQRGSAEWSGVRFDMIDTGGLFSGVDDALIGQVEQRALAEAMTADVILFVTDGESGFVPADTDVANRIRPSGVPVFLVVNKSERGSRRTQTSSDFYRLGFPNVYEISALHGEGTGDLLEDVVALLPRRGQSETAEELRMTITGVPNVGKSSIVNAIVGSEANIVDSRPGTTRDSIDVSVQWNGRRITLVDTAGIKRRTSTKDDISILSSIKSLESIERCDVVVFMLDASRKISNQDVRVGGYAHKAGRGVVVCFNKWDLVSDRERALIDLEKEFRERFKFLYYAPVIFVSATTHQRVNRVLETAWQVKEERDKRIATPDFNRFLEEVVAQSPPQYFGGGTGKIYYGTQVDVAPPTFSLFVNRARFFGRNYLRFFNHRLRERFRFEGTVVRLNLVEKKGRVEPT